MDRFGAAYLANLPANLSAQIVPRAARRLQAQWQEPPAVHLMTRRWPAGPACIVTSSSRYLRSPVIAGPGLSHDPEDRGVKHRGCACCLTDGRIYNNWQI
jgi:hypothetical protein